MQLYLLKLLLMSNFFLLSCFSFPKPFVPSTSLFQGCSIFLESGGSVPCVMSCFLSFHVCVCAYACACVCHAKTLPQVCNRCAGMLLGSSVCGDSACPLECCVYRAMQPGQAFPWRPPEHAYLQFLLFKSVNFSMKDLPIPCRVGGHIQARLPVFCEPAAH